MKTQHAAAVLLVYVFAFASISAAQPAASSRMSDRFIDARSGLSLDDAVRQTVEREPTLRSARADVDAAQGRRRQATLRPNPTLSLEQRQEPAGSDNQTMTQVEWPLDLFRRPSRIAVASRMIDVRERALDDRTRLLIGEVRERYGDAAAAVRDLGLADDAVELVSRQFDLLRQRASEGSVPLLERDQLEVELRRSEAERLLAAGRAEASLIALKKAIGLPMDAHMQLRDRLENLISAATAGDLGSLTAETASQRPDVRMADAEVKLTEARVADALAQARFDVTLFGGYMRMDAGFPQFGLDHLGGHVPIHGVFHYVTAGAMVTMPLRNRNQGEIAAARAEHAGAEARLEAVRLTAQADVAAADVQDAASRRALAVTGSVVELAARNLDVVRQAHELGRTSATDVLVEQRRYLDVERAHTTTMKAAYDAQVALMLARGER